MRRMTLTCTLLLLACGSDDAGTLGASGSETDSTSATDPTSGPGTATMGVTTPTSTSPDTTTTTTTDPDSSGPSSADESSTTDTNSGPPTLHVIHAASDVGTIDLYFAGDANPIAPTLGYGASADVGELPPGDYVLEARLGGAPSADPPLSSTSLTLGDHTQAVAVAAGTLDDDPAVAFRIVALTEAFATPAAGTARVRLVHAGTDAGDLAIDVDADGDPEIAALQRFAASAPDGIAVPAGVAFTLVVHEGEQTLSQFTLPALTDGATAIVTATGRISSLPRQPDGFALLSVTGGDEAVRTAQDPRIHLLHAHPERGTITACVGDRKLAGGLTWLDTTEAIAAFQLEPGNHPLTLREDAVDCSGAIVQGPEQTGVLVAGEQYLAAFGTSTPDDSQLVFAPEAFSLDAAPQAAVRFVNASNRATAGLGTIDGAFLIEDLLFPITPTGGVTDEVVIDSGSQVLSVSSAAGEGSPSVGLEQFDLPTGARMWFVLTGDGTLIDGVPDNLHARIVDTSEHPAPWIVTTQVLTAP